MAFYSITGCTSPLRYRTAGNDVVFEEGGVVAMHLHDSMKLVLQDVTYLPSPPASLLSLTALQQKGWTFDFISGFMSYGNHRIHMYNVRLLSTGRQLAVW